MWITGPVVALENAVNWSMYTADRATHLKIVVTGPAAALVIAVIGIPVQRLNLGVEIMTAQVRQWSRLVRPWSSPTAESIIP